jgi:hypothetical protein
VSPASTAPRSAPYRFGSRVALGTALVALLLTVCAPATPAAAAARGSTPIPVSVSFSTREPRPAVPRDFLGLSFEVADLPGVASYADKGDLVALLRSLGPGVLRFGGVSADTRIAWRDRATPLPSWATGVVEAADFRNLASLSAATGWRIVLTVGLGHFEPEAAAREVAAAKAALGESLEAIEVGNEPNAWALHDLRTEPWTVVQYDAQLAAYRAAIEAAAPGIALAGPDTSGSSAFETWGPAEAVAQRPLLLTGHHYALGCGERPAPTITRLLRPQTRGLEEISLQRYMLVSHQSETPFRLDETNNVSCGGTAGISNTFASALWAVGYLPLVMAEGVSGVNLHGLPANCGGYAPMCAPTPQALAAGTLRVQPEWNALVLVRALIGDRPLRTLTSSPAQPNVQVTTLIAGDGRLHVVVADDDPPGARPVLLRLLVGRAFAGASILSLTGPSRSALTGVRLGGRAIAPDGSWSQPRRLPRAANKHGVIGVRIAPSSAALLTASPRAG